MNIPKETVHVESKRFSIIYEDSSIVIEALFARKDKKHLLLVADAKTWPWTDSNYLLCWLWNWQKRVEEACQTRTLWPVA